MFREDEVYHEGEHRQGLRLQGVEERGHLGLVLRNSNPQKEKARGKEWPEKS